jgi:hypothetical protein
LFFCKLVVWCHWWPAAWTIHFPAAFYTWCLCWICSTWTVGPLRKPMNVIAYVLAVWHSITEFQWECNRVFEWRVYWIVHHVHQISSS